MNAPAYETRDVAARLPAYAALVILASLALGMAAVGVAMLTFWGPHTSAEPPPPAAAGAPGLHTDPLADMDLLLTQWHQRLHSVGWVDREAGIVHVPIDWAMAQVARHGLDVLPLPAETVAPAPPTPRPPQPAEPLEPAS